jgi:circadian clock protein KaiB
MNFKLRLYITGTTPQSNRAINNLKTICASYDLESRYDLEIIDVLKSPELAEGDKIIATPTLVKELPPPIKKVIGDLSDEKAVLLGLDIIPSSKGAS